MTFHCRFMSITSMPADSFTANLSWNFKLQLVFLNRLHAFSTWHLRLNPVFSFQMWHSNIMFILQLSEWDEENVILTGSIDGVVRVSIILFFLLFIFFFKDRFFFFSSNIYSCCRCRCGGSNSTTRRRKPAEVWNQYLRKLTKLRQRTWN